MRSSAYRAPFRTAGEPVSRALSAASRASSDTSALYARCAITGSALPMSGAMASAERVAPSRTRLVIACTVTSGSASASAEVNRPGDMPAVWSRRSVSARNADARSAGTCAAPCNVARAATPSSCASVNIAATRTSARCCPSAMSCSSPRVVTGDGPRRSSSRCAWRRCSAFGDASTDLSSPSDAPVMRGATAAGLPV